jgi:hypothetical protein
MPEVLESPWNVYGKPTYWDGPEFEDCQSRAEFEMHREQILTIGDRYKRELLKVTGGARYGFDQLVRSRLVNPAISAPREGYIERRVAVWKCININCNRTNSIDQIDCACGGTRYGFVCGVCYEYNPEFGQECSLCGIIEYPDQIVRPQTWPVWTPIVEPNPTNCDLSSTKIKSLGYLVNDLDEFDVTLYKHAIECARSEHYCLESSHYEIPVARFSGRAVDLFGEHPGWAPLRPAQLTWNA